MLLTSLTYFLFIAIVFLFYTFLPKRFNSLILLLASYIFCFSQNYQSALVLIFITGLNYFFGLKIDQQREDNQKKRWFIISIVLNVLLLLFFKYIAFSSTYTLSSLTRATSQIGDVFIVIGISYYFLQCISYQNDIRLELIKPERNIANFALYLAFFPKLLAGPVETPEMFLTQISKDKKFDKTDFIYGLQRISIGVFKKIVLADRLSIIVNNVFEVSDTASSLSLVLGVYFFTIQLYFDLSAYADIAIGTARLFGFKLTENFRLPFLATSITEFWRRWHISLINWLNTYIYSPVVYYLRSSKRNGIIVAIIITFVVSGIWHGLGLNFLLWGILYAGYMVFELVTKKQRNKGVEFVPNLVMKPLLVVVTFNVVAFTNLLIRFSDVTSILSIVEKVFTFKAFLPTDIYSDFIWQLSKKGELEFTFYTLVTIVLTAVFLMLESRWNTQNKVERINYFKMVTLLVLILLFGIFTENDQFLYVIY
jgi:alginate O-acetyltransferase complex protein AlgI